jgi:hypothetical protein
MNDRSRLGCAFLFAAALFAGARADAIVVTPTQDTTALIDALVGSAGTGIHVTGVSLAGHRDELDLGAPVLPIQTLTSSGTFTNASGTYGVGPGVVLSTGAVEGLSLGGTTPIAGYGDGSNQFEANSWAYGATFPITDPDQPGVPSTAAQDLLLDPLTGTDPATASPYPHFDVTELVIQFDMEPGFDTVAFNVVFGSEEFPEFVGSPYIDAFGMFLNGTNIAFVGGQPVNIDHPDMAALTGTELDGVLAPGGNPLLTFGGTANASGNTLRFIVTDTSDGIYDTTVYFSALRGVAVPEPDVALLLLAAALSCWAARR